MLFLQSEASGQNLGHPLADAKSALSGRAEMATKLYDVVVELRCLQCSRPADVPGEPAAPNAVKAVLRDGKFRCGRCGGNLAREEILTAA